LSPRKFSITPEIFNYYNLTLFRISWVFGRYLSHSDFDLHDYEAVGFGGMRDMSLHFSYMVSSVKRIDKTKRWVKSVSNFNQKLWLMH